MTAADPHATLSLGAIHLDAGDFLDWTRDTLASFSSGGGNIVACGDCRACCRAGYFIPVRQDELSTRRAIPTRLLVIPVGGAEQGDRLIATRRSGDCALLLEGECSIYGQRPQACRDYDCRLFAAAGISSGVERVDMRVRRWRFAYRTSESRAAHQATRAVAEFMLNNAEVFPGRRVPTRPADVAVAALKAHQVLLCGADRPATARDVALAIIESCRTFDAGATAQIKGVGRNKPELSINLTEIRAPPGQVRPPPRREPGNS